MVYSEGLASVEPWLYRQGFNVDSWLLPDTFSHDNDLLARALHNTVSASPSHTLSPSSVFLHSPHGSSAHTLSSNASGGSNPEVGVKRKKHDCILSEGKATKRRSRPSKKPHTTFITADPSNFRQMVQQVTGSKYMDHTPIVKPEPHRLVVNRLPGVASAVPTLDTSAFLSTHHHENLFLGRDTVVGLLPSEESNATVLNESGSSAVEFDTYPTFPTLESWKVV